MVSTTSGQSYWSRDEGKDCPECGWMGDAEVWYDLADLSFDWKCPQCNETMFGYQDPREQE